MCKIGSSKIAIRTYYLGKTEIYKCQKKGPGRMGKVEARQEINALL